MSIVHRQNEEKKREKNQKTQKLKVRERSGENGNQIEDRKNAISKTY